MAEGTQPAKRLTGHKVALTGKFGSLTRSSLEELIRSHGGDIMATVSRQTSLLVVGQERLPLRKDGRLSARLVAARRLQHQGAITILTENELLERLGHERAPSGSCRLSIQQLSQLLKVSCPRIQRWVHAGILQPAEIFGDIDFFDYQHVQWAKSLRDFQKAGVSAKRVQRSIERLKKWLPALGESCTNQGVMERDGRLIVRLKDGRLAESSGQLVFDFVEEGHHPALAVAHCRQPTAEDWFQIGSEKEQAGELPEAAEAYRKTLVIGGPDAITCFNLANVLYEMGYEEQAAERFRQATEVNPQFVEAWNNLGNTLAKLSHRKEAVQAFKTALDIDSNYLDAHFNLADVYEQMGKRKEASAHWQIYARYDRASEWGRYARQQASQLRNRG
ncbi:MAG: tetratricopeptide repeat protein [Gemmataceae bacterium]